MKLSTCFAGLALAALSQAGHAQTAQYSAFTAPDAAAREVLSQEVARFEQGARSSADVSAAIHRNYAQIIEQNFARLVPADARKRLDALSDMELGDIAQLYVTATADAKRPGRLLHVLAARLDGPRLARLANAFGYTPVYAAVQEVAPLKAQSFAQGAGTVTEAPVPGGALPSSAVRAKRYGAAYVALMEAPQPMEGVQPMAGPFRPNVSMTPQEIYTGFRSMMTGSWAAEAAVYESSVYMGARLGAAWLAGYGAGTVVANLMQTYTPTAWDTLSCTVGSAATWTSNWTNNIVNYSLTNLYQLGSYQATTAPNFAVPMVAQNDLMSWGGDWSVCIEWANNVAGIPTKCFGGDCHYTN